jgi:hypothetical protein
MEPVYCVDSDDRPSLSSSRSLTKESTEESDLMEQDICIFRSSSSRNLGKELTEESCTTYESDESDEWTTADDQSTTASSLSRARHASAAIHERLHRLNLRRNLRPTPVYSSRLEEPLEMERGPILMTSSQPVESARLLQSFAKILWSDANYFINGTEIDEFPWDEPRTRKDRVPLPETVDASENVEGGDDNDDLVSEYLKMCVEESEKNLNKHILSSSNSMISLETEESDFVPDSLKEFIKEAEKTLTRQAENFLLMVDGVGPCVADDFVKDVADDFVEDETFLQNQASMNSENVDAAGIYLLPVADIALGQSCNDTTFCLLSQSHDNNGLLDSKEDIDTSSIGVLLENVEVAKIHLLPDVADTTLEHLEQSCDETKWFLLSQSHDNNGLLDSKESSTQELDTSSRRVLLENVEVADIHLLPEVQETILGQSCDGAICLLLSQSHANNGFFNSETSSTRPLDASGLTEELSDKSLEDSEPQHVHLINCKDRGPSTSQTPPRPHRAWRKSSKSPVDTLHVPDIGRKKKKSSSWISRLRQKVTVEEKSQIKEKNDVSTDSSSDASSITWKLYHNAVVNSNKPTDDDEIRSSKQSKYSPRSNWQSYRKQRKEQINAQVAPQAKTQTTETKIEGARFFNWKIYPNQRNYAPLPVQPKAE